jgi:hypothetical protein
MAICTSAESTLLTATWNISSTPQRKRLQTQHQSNTKYLLLNTATYIKNLHNTSRKLMKC